MFDCSVAFDFLTLWCYLPLATVVELAVGSDRPVSVPRDPPQVAISFEYIMNFWMISFYLFLELMFAWSTAKINVPKQIIEKIIIYTNIRRKGL